MKTDVTTRAALVAAVAVGVYFVVRGLLGAISAFAAELHYRQGFAPLGAQLQSSVLDLFLHILPIVIGVFVGFRLVAPISGGLALANVLVRSLVASAAGALLAFVVAGLYSFFSSFTGALFANSFPFSAFGDVIGAMLTAITGAVADFFSLVPLVALAAVLLWVWLRRRAGTASV